MFYLFNTDLKLFKYGRQLFCVQLTQFIYIVLSNISNHNTSGSLAFFGEQNNTFVIQSYAFFPSVFASILSLALKHSM